MAMNKNIDKRNNENKDTQLDLLTLTYFSDSLLYNMFACIE